MILISDWFGYVLDERTWKLVFESFRSKELFMNFIKLI